MNRRSRRPRVLSSRPEGLESRDLLAAGISIGLNVVMELGQVSRAAALKGVEVAATIPAHGSVTFEFEAAAAGDYRLEVRHVGDGLTLEATGPAGSASVDPGPAGPFSTIALPLKAADYAIKASATGDRPVFVDWELLLTTGVGQSAAIGSTLAATPAAVPLPGASATATPPASTSPPAPSASWGPAVSPSLATMGGPAGRSDPGRAISPVGPTSPGGELALVHAGDGLPVGALKALVPAAEEDLPASVGPTPLLALEVLGDGERDLEALHLPSWFDDLARFQAWATDGPATSMTGAGSPDGPATSTTDEGPAVAVSDPPGEGSTASSAVAASPGVIASGVVLVSVARRWRAGDPAKRRGLLTRPDFFPRSMIG